MSENNQERFSQFMKRFGDRHIALVFLLLGAIPAVLFSMEKGYIYFYQNFAPESIMWACGLGMLHPGEVLDPLSKFTYGHLRTFDCSTFDKLQSPGPTAFFAKSQPYFTWPTAVLWRLFGLNYYAILPLVAVLYGLYASGVYALSRLFLDRKFAVPAAIMLCLAPLTVGMSIYLRGFSKALFFIWAIVFLIMAIREQKFRRSLILAMASSAVIGIGYGFRADLVVLFPIGTLILAIGVRPKSKSSGKSIWAAGIIAPIVFLATGFVTSAPVWTQIDIANNGGSAIIQGASEYFRTRNGLTRAGYTVGWTYSDELTLSGIAAKERPKIPNWDAQEPEPLKGASQAQQLSTKNLLSWADVFAADFFAQSLKSAGWVLGFPALYVRENLGLTFAKSNAKGRFLSAKQTLPLYSFIGQFWFPLIGALGALALLWRRFVRSGREALCLTLLFGFLLTYPALQFSARHVFHLEFVWVLSTFSLLALLFDARQSAERRKQFGLYVAVFALAISAAYGGAVWWQKKAVEQEIFALLAFPREHVETKILTLSNASVFHKVAVPEHYLSLIGSKADAMTPQIRYKGIQWDVRAAADRLVVQLDGAQCDVSNRAIQLRYNPGPEIWQPFDAKHSFANALEGSKSSAFIPAFYRPTQYFSGILIPAKFADCNIKVERIIGESRLPMVMAANVELAEQGGKLAGSDVKWPGWFGAEIDASSVTIKMAKPKKAQKADEEELKKLIARQ